MIISRKLQSKKLIPNNIVLTGFMGTGKSTIGKDLAKKLEMEYVDTDAFIENRVNMTIKDIFEKYGEADH
ncbi:shikimate kinase [Anaerosolibacter sp.]|uniref:shikimate kinase n=1 Tax=Anaerosolibacter sp. TaxID=1872527 RepID=UPI0039EF8374